MTAARLLQSHRHPFSSILLRWWWRCRYLVVATCCALAAKAALEVIAPPPPPLAPVVVAAKDLVAGHELKPGDLAVVNYPSKLVSPSMLNNATTAIGRTPPIQIAAGTPLTIDLISGGGLAALAPPGTAVVAVELDPVTTQMLEPGDRIDLISTSSDPPGYLTRDALVLPTGRKEPESTGGLFGAATNASTPVTLLAVSPEDAPAITAASGQSALSAVLVP